MKRRCHQGLTIAELLVSMPVGFLILGLITGLMIYTGRLYDSALRDAGARQQLGLICLELESVLNRTSSEGLHIDAAGEVVTVQTITGVTATANPEWSDSLLVYRYDAAQQCLYQGRVRLTDLGVTPQENIPQCLSPDQIAQAGAAASQALACNVTQFTVARTIGTPALRLEVGVEQQSRLGKTEKTSTRTSFRLWSSADV